jgi:hypothetical protein
MVSLLNLKPLSHGYRNETIRWTWEKGAVAKRLKPKKSWGQSS